LDNNNDYYSAFATWLNGTDYRVCIEWCAQIPHPDFVGVEIYTYYHEYYEEEFGCFCDFSTRIPDDINVADYDPSADAWNGRAYGSIQNTTEWDGMLCYRYDNFTMSIPTSAVRIELNTGEDINLFDVKVMDTTGEDIAQGKPAAQSSTLQNFDASLAVDGLPLTFSHTYVASQAEMNVWWNVDLQGETRVKSVVIKNRWCKSADDPEGCLCRLSNATVLLLDDAGTAIATQTLGDTCKQLELEVSDFIPSRDPNDFSYNPTSFPTIFPTSTPSEAPSNSPVEPQSPPQPTPRPTRTRTKAGK
jgi:hypothetical protein